MRPSSFEANGAVEMRLDMGANLAPKGSPRSIARTCSACRHGNPRACACLRVSKRSAHLRAAAAGSCSSAGRRRRSWSPHRKNVRDGIAAHELLPGGFGVESRVSCGCRHHDLGIAAHGIDVAELRSRPHSGSCAQFRFLRAAANSQLLPRRCRRPASARCQILFRIHANGVAGASAT